MTIDSIRNGLVIDHITAGKAMELYRLLGLDQADCPVALIQRVPSRKMGTKDIIKIDGEFDVDVDILGYVDPDATVNVIRDGAITEKKDLTLPEKLTNVLHCKNPRCITTTEQELSSVFTLTDKANRVYRCFYCEAKAEQ
ncbi:MAG: aspartate carbamoyltransferase regulatory subunit [Clostridia bacterium]|nr:aspartate carbamoyltransferase regulatory subunit [Clostridia bacterium]